MSDNTDSKMVKNLLDALDPPAEKKEFVAPKAASKQPNGFMSSMLKDKPKSKKFQKKDLSSKFSSTAIDELLEDYVDETRNRILVIGIGGAGSNAVNRLTLKGIDGAVTVAVNTDAYHLRTVNSELKVLVGRNLTEGMGAGNDPVIGEAAAEESLEDLQELIEEADLVFVTTGMGGGTGTGAAPVIAEVAKEAGALVIGVCTLPFNMEGDFRVENALKGLEQFYKTCDTVVVIPNEKLLELAPDMPIDTAFEVADEILIRAVRGIVNLIITPAFVNVDFADIRQILKRGGSSVIGVGEAEGEDRIENAIRESLSNNLLDVKLMDSKAALININGGTNLKLKEVQKSINLISQEISASSEIIWGTNIDPNLKDRIQVTTILSGVDSPYEISFEGVDPNERWDAEPLAININSVWDEE